MTNIRILFFLSDHFVEKILQQNPQRLLLNHRQLVIVLRFKLRSGSDMTPEGRLPAKHLSIAHALHPNSAVLFSAPRARVVAVVYLLSFSFLFFVALM